MKICKANWQDHHTLGTFSMDFTKGDRTPYETIVLAGENGSGKTTVLDCLFKYFSGNPLRNVNSPLKETEVRLSLEICLDNYDSIRDSSGCFATMATTKTDLKNITDTEFLKNDNARASVTDEERSTAQATYSQVAINYNAKSISATTDKDLDKSDKKSERSSDDLATEITQLFLDIAKEDSSELDQWVHKNPGVAPPEEVQRKRIKRFINAFEHIFDDKLKFKGIQGLQVLFEKNGTTIPINQLSSGEKQIVFRGGFLLRNQGILNGTVILIDEPELSMHPKWQERILDFYRTLFVDESGEQTSQIFIATHSEYVLRSGLENRENTLIIILREKEGCVEADKIVAPLALPSITSAEINYLAFGIASIDYHIQLYGYLQSKTSNESISNCDNYIVGQPQYDPAKHEKSDNYTNGRGKTVSYRTLPTYIRNAIDHPDSGRIFTPSDLQTSIELLIELCK